MPGGLKWERTVECKPAHNIISSDFPKYFPNPAYFTSLLGKARIEWVLSYEYQRMWVKERELWVKRFYPENIEDVDIIKAYVASFKNAPPVVKEEKKEPFKMKKFQNIPARTSNTRLPGDKAMSFNRIKSPEKKKSKKK